ncbi:MAG: DnaA regulatory inactivator Hda [Gammaproteobacteria bacterium]|uniref:DnaA regulatory inactivator Hda n=1 Tax=Luteimonas sp. JM171 TaxID=1896164 RepID=UPI0008585247|nr:DnaA regulatory inactivator Hda [Luteimonas sp. JM171]AOH36306.1 DnaA regulatory inactivator Hda [Luteimonas sp. JM171]NLC61951.1 DnaA regulatory inactivator Hda [Gammaproteobacteria bacterium]
MQLPLALRFPPDQRFDTFVGAPAGALEQLRALASGAGSDWLYLAGPASTGKSHLALAACADAQALGRRVAYLPLASAAGRMEDALSALDDYDLVALDGLDAVAGRREDEQALFDFHNRARDAGTAVLYSARVPAVELPVTLPDLRSRLAQCVRVRLQPLDDEGRREVLRLRARRRGLQMDAAAIDWLLRRVDRELASLTGLLDRLDRESLAAQRRITVPFLRKVLVGS